MPNGGTKGKLFAAKQAFVGVKGLFTEFYEIRSKLAYLQANVLSFANMLSTRGFMSFFFNELFTFSMLSSHGLFDDRYYAG